MDLNCKRCGKNWTYGGERKFYATCPDCKTSVKISEDETPKPVENKKAKAPSKKVINNVEKRMVEQEKMLGDKLEKFGKFFK
jgi:predicted  nucleic acid-binding Zn-ribbon protein